MEIEIDPGTTPLEITNNVTQNIQPVVEHKVEFRPGRWFAFWRKWLLGA